MDRQHTIRHGNTSAVILQQGAELSALSAHGHAWLWDAARAWPRHAPVLFPIVGRLRDDTLRHQGQSYRLTQHGFARDLAFRWVERDAAACRLELTADPGTHAHFPFDFRLTLAYRVEDAVLRCDAHVLNTGSVRFPFSIGAHPAFCWPLPGATNREGHALLFQELPVDHLQTDRIEGGLLFGQDRIALPTGQLALEDALFQNDALVFRDLPVREAHFTAPSGAAVAMRWEGYRDFGVWTKPDGAGFLCLEPWRGHASPADWDGEFSRKPGIVTLPPGQEATFTWSVTLTPPRH